MSAASLRVLRGQIERGTANLDTIEAWVAKKLLTATEAEEARSYWHSLYDPPPPPEPTPEPVPAVEPETPVAGESAETTEEPSSDG